LRQEGGRVEIENPARNLAAAAALEADKKFEKILGEDRYRTFQWYRKGLDRASGVAQVLDRSGNGQGTGFLVRGTDVHQSLGHEWVVVTNAHVISDDPAEQRSSPAVLPADEARIRFEAKDPNVVFEVDQILFSSPRTELDCTIVRLNLPVEHEKAYPIAKRLPLVDQNQRVYVIGHPRGGGLSYSIDDNLLLDHEKTMVHYRAPTEGGSSGSPVFNQQWDLLALHHAGGMKMKKLNGKEGTYPANEGLYFQSIRDAVAAKLG
jgi:V8-like Glu-specific endopeptidase